MKASIKLAVIGAVALMGGVANAANVNTLSSSATGSSLLLLLKNYTDSTYFYSELSATVADVKDKASVMSDDPGYYTLDESATTGSLNVPSVLNGYTSANLSAYLLGNTSDTISWTIMGSRTGNGTQQLGQQSFVMTAATDQLAAYWETAATATASQAFANLFVAGELNGTGVTFVNGVSATNGWDSTNVTGKNADISFNGAGFENGAALGTAQSLYLMSTGGDEGPGANTYKSAYTLTLSSAGVLSYDAPTTVTPIPAAIWLLGSGLMGLVGIGRRRNAAAVVAA